MEAYKLMSNFHNKSFIPEHKEILYIGFLLQGPEWTQDVTPELEALQEAHLANLRRLKNSGELLVTGPFTDDGEMRGVYIFRVKTMEEALALTQTDPSVKAGRLKFNLHPWLVNKQVFAHLDKGS